MENVTVTSGSGEKFTFPLPEEEELKNIARKINAAWKLPPRERLKNIAGLLKKFFPAHYRNALERITQHDLFKLVRIFQPGSCRKSREVPERELPFSDDAEPFSFCSETQSAPSDYSNDVIRVSFCYKWSLEYAASLSPELLQRCLAIAGYRRKRYTGHGENISADELSEAVRRGREALRKLKMSAPL